MSSCEKVIEPKISNVKNQLVIEGEITNSNIGAIVRISNSVSFAESGLFNGVSDAFVTIADDLGNLDTLYLQSPGIYAQTSLTGIPGRTYVLNVTYNGMKFHSSCKMPNEVLIDSLMQKNQIANDNTRRFLIPVYNDPVSEVNFYRFKVFSLNKPINKIFIRKDVLTNGKKVTQPIGPFFMELKPGDTATLQVYGIESNVYTYFSGLEQTLNAYSSAPSNPPSNIIGGCLGYFSAHTVASKKILITD
ncbi:MAG TPA: DUF4249 domain-containing protein [Bacteroidia bacterium]